MATRAITAPLISLAILKVNWDTRQRDYIDNFVPMVAEAVRLSEDDVVSIPELQQCIRQRFGLRLPSNNLRIILNRLAKADFVKIENKAYFRNQAKLASLNFSQVERQVTALHEGVVASLRQFARNRFDIDWDQASAEVALHSYLETYRLLDPDASELPHDLKPDHPGANFVVGAFVQQLRVNDEMGFHHLETIVKGDILATAIFLPDPARAAQKFRKTYVYFDTSFLMFALGHAGEARSAPCSELLDLLHQSGAELRCFSHTLDEIRSILVACAIRIERKQLKDSYGPSIEYFLERGYGPSEIRVFEERAQVDLKALRVEVVDTPDLGGDYMIDEQAFAKFLQERVHYTNENALWRDVSSISSIVRLRRGHQTHSVEECRAVFVSTNAGLIRAARDFAGVEHEPVIPPGVTDHALTNMLWLKLPIQADDLPRKRLIAASYAATEPDDALWDKYLKQLRKDLSNETVSEQDYLLLRHSLQARSALMELTLGDEHAFAAGTVKEILDVVHDDLQREIKNKLQEETASREDAEREAAAAQGKVAALEAEKNEILAASDTEVERARDDARAREARRRLHVRGKAVRAAKFASKALLWSAAGLWVIALAATYSWGEEPIRLVSGRAIVFALQLAVFLWSAASELWGTRIPDLVRRFEVWLATGVERRLLRLTDLPEHAAEPLPPAGPSAF